MKHAYNLSFSTEKIGHKFTNEGFVIADDIFGLLFERLDEAMMRKRIDREFKSYAIKNTLQMSIHAFNISNIFNDKGDDFSKKEDFEPYNYEEESREPSPPIKDNCGRNLTQVPEASLKARVRANIPESKGKKMAKKVVKNIIGKANLLSVRFRGFSNDGSTRSPSRTSRGS